MEIQMALVMVDMDKMIGASMTDREDPSIAMGTWSKICGEKSNLDLCPANMILKCHRQQVEEQPLVPMPMPEPEPVLVPKHALVLVPT